LIAKRIGAKKLSAKSNEFEWKGQRITIHSARHGNLGIGVTYKTLPRIQVIVGAFEVAPDEFELWSISPEVFQANMRDSPTGKGKTALLQKKTFTEQGKFETKLFLRANGDEVAETQEQLDIDGQFQVNNQKDGKEKVLRSIALRRGQLKFRNELLQAYQGSCAVTGTSIADVLEAAHIAPYSGDSTNCISNGILLRCDIHALFDLKFLSVEPETLSIYCSEKIRQEAIYKELHGKKIKVPTKENQRPNFQALKLHFQQKEV
jgi:hypothetical protein